MLQGLRVLDWTNEPGFLAGRILGDLGADVIKIEPPGGDLEGRRTPTLGGVDDPERSLSWLANNTSKRGIVLDLASEIGLEQYRGLARTADVILETFAPGWLEGLGVGYAVLAAENPGLVHCAMTPFGQTGPYASFRAHDLVLVAMGGNMAGTGDPGRPPVRSSMPTAYYHAGPEAALAVLMALYQRERTGRGEFIDLSLHETQLQTLLTGAGQYPLTGRLPERSGPRMGRTREIWQASDGMVSYGLRGGQTRIPNLRATVEWMAEANMAPPWLREYDWDSYSHLEVSDEDLVRIEDTFGSFFASKTVRELYGGALERRILLAPCNDAREILEHVQLRSRELFRRVDYAEWNASLEHPDFFAKFRNHPVHIRRQAPKIGEHQEEVLSEIRERPAREIAATSAAGETDIFSGLHVLEIGSGAAGPVATRYFAEHGAHVIRVESGVRPDFLRILFLTRESQFGVDGSPMFVLLNGNKDSVTLNLKRPEALELVRKLVAWADVLCENYAPGVMERFGLDYESVREIRPDIVMASGCLFGQTGPQRSYPGFGAQGSAISGFNHVTGWPEGPANGPYGTITDSLSPRYVALSIAAALWRRRCTGEGEYIDVSQIETAVYSLAELVLRYSANGEVVMRRGNRDEQAAPHGVYPCAADDRWIAIAIRSNDDWRKLCAEMGDPAWAQEERFATLEGRLEHMDELDADLGRWTAAFEPHDLMQRLQSSGIEAGAVQSFPDLIEDPQLAHREHWVSLRHSNLGEMLFERSGFRFSSGSGKLERPGPNLGEHNSDVLGGILGLSSAEIQQLIDAEIVA